MEQKLVSVVIPVYNGEKTFRQCLDSVLRQGYDNYEVNVVDNNSTDNTKKIIEEFQKKYKNLFYYFEQEKSVGKARNLGINNSQGEILCFTDSDCILPLDWVRKMTRPIIVDGEKVVAGSEKNLTENYWTKQIQNSNRIFDQRIIKGKYIEGIDGKNFAIDKNLMARLMFDPSIKMFDDLDLFVRLRRVSKIRFLSDVKVGHFHRNSMKKFVRMMFIRGFWTYNIYKKCSKEERKEIVMFESISLNNFLVCPFWLVKRVLTKSPKESFYILTSELSWRAGIIWAMVKSL